MHNPEEPMRLFPSWIYGSWKKQIINFVLNYESYFRRGDHCASPIFRTATTHTGLVIECKEGPEEECTTAIKRQGTLITAALLIKYHFLVAKFVITIFATNVCLQRAITLRGTESKSLQLPPLQSVSESELWSGEEREVMCYEREPRSCRDRWRNP